MTDINLNLTSQQISAILGAFGCTPPASETPQKEWRVNVSLSVALRIGMYGSEAPTASFGYVVNGQDVTFTYTGEGAETVVWDFGDGGNGTVQTNPTHTYVGAGPFTVTLTACNPMGCTTTSQSVPLAPPAATWDEELDALNPIYNFPLTEASGNFANIGSLSGTVPTGTATGTPTYQAGSFIAPDTGISLNESGDGFSFSAASATLDTFTVLTLIKTDVSRPITPVVFDEANPLDSLLYLQFPNTSGVVQARTYFSSASVTSDDGALSANEYNLIFLVCEVGQPLALYVANESGAGTVQNVDASASGTHTALTGEFISPIKVRGSAGTNTVIDEAFAIIPMAMTLEQMQALADTLTW